MEGVSIKTTKSNTEELSPEEWEKSHLETIAEALPEGPNNAVHFYAEDQFKSSDISLKVEGVGRLNFHRQSVCVPKLQLAAGAGGQIPAESVLVLLNQAELSRVLDSVRVGLGLDGHLEAQQGAMLVGGGGRCDPPQDDDEGGDVVGTLVIVLPFLHRGGDVVLQRGTERRVFVSDDASPDVVKCVGFLADSVIEVGKVSEGCFVALTYKLVLKSKPRPRGLYANPHLICAVADYFDDLESDDVVENKFVCMLDEYYTERSLKWNLLRGDDRLTGSALIAVAEALRLVPFLALVEIQHACSNSDPCVHHDTDCVRFLKFVDSNNVQQADAGRIQLKKKEICWRGSHWNFTNGKGSNIRYGAAVVMWSASASSELQFAFDFNGCLEKLRAMMKSAGKEKEVVEMVKKGARYFRSENKRQDFLLLTEIALYIKDDHASMCILSHFKWDVLNCDVEKRLALLEAQYGTEWCISLLFEWKCRDTSLQCDLDWAQSYILQDVNQFASVYLSFGGTPQLVNYILNQQLIHFRSCSNSFQSSSMEENLSLVLNFCLACISISDKDLLDKLLRYLFSNSSIYTGHFLFTVYWKLKSTISPREYNYIERLKSYLASIINSEIEKVTSRKKDWLIKTGLLDCACRQCKEVNAFLLSETESVVEMIVSWKLQKHLECICRRLKVPVGITVEALFNQAEKKVRVCKLHGKELYLAKLGFHLRQL